DSNLGHSVAGGDFNGDGRADILVASPGSSRAHLVYGYHSAPYPDIDLDLMPASTGYAILSETGTDGLGHALASAGDFNGDGRDDLLLGAYRNHSGRTEYGAAWLVLGMPGTTRGALNLATLGATEGLKFTGTAAGDQLGQAVSHGDLNGDGFSDLIIGAPGSDAIATDAGTLTVELGRALGSPILAGLTGSASADNIVGTDGNDDVFGNGGADAISTGAGNDIIAIGDLDFAKINGGRGQLGDRTGVLALHSGHTQLDVTTLQPEQIRNIELIELGDLNNSLHLSKLGLLALSRETNRLYVHGGSSDIVTVRSGEVWAEAGTEAVGGTEYNVYIAEGAELYIQPAVTQTGIGS